MFRKAIIKLTAWYLLILMSLSLLFSLSIYLISINEVDSRIADVQNLVDSGSFDADPYSDTNSRLLNAFLENQRVQASANILIGLTYVNLAVLVVGAAMSYFLARWALRHIEQPRILQNRFTSDASHELRTPLAAMRAELEVALKDSKLSKSEMRKILESNLEEVNRLTQLSQTLLYLSRLDYSGLEFQTVDLGLVIRTVVQRYDKNSSRFKLSLPEAPLNVKANSSSIAELFTILIENAQRYSPIGSEISAALRTEGKKAIFEISNQGEGIPRDKLPYIFDRFYRGDDSRTDEGVGLGLALAKDIVSIHNGELLVKSTPNKKTTFIVRLPLKRKN